MRRQLDIFRIGEHKVLIRAQIDHICRPPIEIEDLSIFENDGVFK